MNEQWENRARQLGVPKRIFEGLGDGDSVYLSDFRPLNVTEGEFPTAEIEITVTEVLPSESGTT